ncbi:MAG: phage holin family protein [Bacteroidales bacterium]|jgi:hypothetical protein
MEENMKSIESLLESTAEYGKTSYELIKLKLMDKVSDVLSSFVPLFVISILLASFLLFLNFGVALWIGEICGKIYYGFFAVGAFYGLIALIFYLFMNKWLKRIFYDYIVRKISKEMK